MRRMIPQKLINEIKDLILNFDSEVVSILENIGISRNEDDEITIDAPVVFADGGNAFSGFDADDFQFDADNLVQIKNKGTKLYKHLLKDNGSTGYQLILITDSPTPLDFATLSNPSLIYNYLYHGSINVVSFCDIDGQSIYYDSISEYFSAFGISNDQVRISQLDDIDLTTTNDTVTPL